MGTATRQSQRAGWYCLASGAAEQEKDRGISTESNNNASAGVAPSWGRQSLCKSKTQARGSPGIKVPLLPAAKLGYNFMFISLKTPSSKHSFLSIRSECTGSPAHPTESWKLACSKLFLKALPGLLCRVSPARNFGQLCYTGVTEMLLSYLHFILT